MQPPTPRMGLAWTLMLMGCAWGGRFERTYVDIRIFNPHTPSNHHRVLLFATRGMKTSRSVPISEEYVKLSMPPSHHLSCTSATGGMAREATVFYNQLASYLASKWDKSYSSPLHWLCCHVTFSLLRLAICCIRGARSSCGHTIRPHPANDLAVAESQ